MALLTKDELRGCSDCYGDGKHVQYNGITEEVVGTCRRCQGMGKELTEVGQEVVRFLREHYGLEPRRGPR